MPGLSSGVASQSACSVPPLTFGTFSNEFVDQILRYAPDAVLSGNEYAYFKLQGSLKCQTYCAMDARKDRKSDLVKLTLMPRFLELSLTLTEKLVYGFDSRGTPAYGAIFDPWIVRAPEGPPFSLFLHNYHPMQSFYLTNFNLVASRLSETSTVVLNRVGVNTELMT